MIELPCASPTSCTFGGRDLETLYVTSSRFGMSPESLEGNDRDGGLYAVDGEGRGPGANRFR